MPQYTIEMTFRVPHYRHTTYEAANLEEAIEKARQDDDWEQQKDDYDTCGPEYITGAWEGPKDYEGDCLFAEHEPFVSQHAPAAPSPDWQAIARDLAGALDACATQIHQMKGMFPDNEDIANALHDADEATEAFSKATA